MTTYRTYYFNLPAPRFGESQVTANIQPTLYWVTEWARMYTKTAGGPVTVQEQRNSEPFLEVHADGTVRELAAVTFPEPEPERYPPDRSCPDCGCVGCWCN